VSAHQKKAGLRTAKECRTTVMLPIYRATVDPIVEMTIEGHSISCTRGCAACCYQLIGVSVVEALAIAAYVVANFAVDEITKLRCHIRDDVQYLENEHVGRETYFADERACVFLENVDKSKWRGLCGIYAARPTPCRTYHVVSPPEHCRPTYDGRVQAINFRKLELGVMAQILDRAQELGVYGAPLPVAMQWAFDWIYAGKEIDMDECARWSKRLINYENITKDLEKRS